MRGLDKAMSGESDDSEFYSPSSSKVKSPGSSYSSDLDDLDKRFFNIHKDPQGCSSTLSIDLQTYVDDFRNNKTQYDVLRTELVKQVTGFDATFFWSNMLDMALEGQVNDEQASMIKETPASKFLEESFIELVKNGMDEIVLSCEQVGRKPQIELKLTIDLSKEDAIGMTVSDNGRGFPASFLSKVATTESRINYIDHKGSEKQAGVDSDDESEEEVSPALFGGAGRGLRILMARVLTGDSLVRGVREPKFVKPAISMIDLRNGADGSGATIEIITSLQPLQTSGIGYSVEAMKKKPSNSYSNHASGDDRYRPVNRLQVLEITSSDDDENEEASSPDVRPGAMLIPIGSSDEESSPREESSCAQPPFSTKAQETKVMKARLEELTKADGDLKNPLILNSGKIKP